MRATTEPQRPNVLLITADQLRADALGFAGNRIVSTPNLDRLASAGVVFESAYVNCPVCMASRAALASPWNSRAIPIRY